MYKIRPAARTFQTKIRLDSCHSHKNQEDFNLNKQKKIPTKNVGFLMCCSLEFLQLKNKHIVIIS